MAERRYSGHFRITCRGTCWWRLKNDNETCGYNEITVIYIVSSGSDEGKMVMSEQVPSANPFGRSDCDETIHELYHFLDGELTEERRREIEFHLNHCAPCVDIVSFESELRRVIADRCREQVPEELRNKIAELINHELDSSQSGS